MSMYDIGQAKRQGLAPHVDEGALRRNLNEVAAQRWAEVDGAERTMVIGTPQVLTASSTAIDREFFDYYRTGVSIPRDDRFSRTSDAPMCCLVISIDWIAAPVLFITGDQAITDFSDTPTAERRPKSFSSGAGHVDLYDRVGLIPWDKLQSFFGTHLAGAKGRS